MKKISRFFSLSSAPAYNHQDDRRSSAVLMHHRPSIIMDDDYDTLQQHRQYQDSEYKDLPPSPPSYDYGIDNQYQQRQPTLPSVDFAQDHSSTATIAQPSKMAQREDTTTVVEIFQDFSSAAMVEDVEPLDEMLSPQRQPSRHQSPPPQVSRTVSTPPRSLNKQHIFPGNTGTYNHVPAEQLMELLNLNHSAVVNGGSFKKGQGKRTSARVRFSNQDILCTYHDDDMPMIVNMSSPNNVFIEQRQPVAPARSNTSSLIFDSVPQDSAMMTVTELPVLEKIQNEMSTQTVAEELKPVEKELPAPPPPPAKPQTCDSATSAILITPPAPKPKRRHIQIQARPVQQRTVSVQINTISASNVPVKRMSTQLSPRSSGIATMTTESSDARETESALLKAEIQRTKQELEDTKQLLENISEQAYKKMLALMQDNKQLHFKCEEYKLKLAHETGSVVISPPKTYQTSRF